MLKTFDQRYVVNDNFVADKSNVKAAIIEIGGEGPLRKAPGGDRERYDVLGNIAMKYNAPIF